jgi:outer membrane protein assembly factor BamB
MKTPLLAPFVALAATLLAFGAPTALGTWPQFRGPRAAGVDATQPLPVTWDVATGRNVRWQTPIPGLGHAAPIATADRVYVATAVRPGTAELKVGLYGDIEPANDQESHQWRLLALDAARGRVIWDVVGHEGIPRVKRHPKASHCNSTPATDGSRVVALFGSEGLFCFDRDGKPLWKRDLGPMDSGFFAVRSAQWGFASSPVIHQGRVVVLCDVQTNSFLAAFDLADGRELWRTPRRDVPTWGTPTIVEAPGPIQIVVNGWHHTGGYDFETGRERWRLDGGGDIPVPTPILAQGLIIQTSAHGRFRPLRAIRPDATGDITPTDPGTTNAAIVWAHARQGNYMQTPITVGDLIWSASDNGVLTCVEARTGVIRYSERLPSGQGYTASPVSDGRHLYFPSETGNVYVVPAQPRFAIAATNTLGGTCLATPAIAGGALLFRTRTHVVAISETTR